MWVYTSSQAGRTVKERSFSDNFGVRRAEVWVYISSQAGQADELWQFIQPGPVDAARPAGWGPMRAGRPGQGVGALAAGKGSSRLHGIEVVAAQG